MKKPKKPKKVKAEKKLTEDVDQVQAVYRARSRSNFLTFMYGLTIPAATGKCLFLNCIVDFQREFFEDIGPSLRALLDGKRPEKRRFWMERTKKAAKDSDLAVCVVWLMAFSRRPLKCQICASNRRQAGIIEDRVVELLYYNPWLNEFVEVIQGTIRNKQMQRAVWTRIEATGSAGEAQGQTPDLLILNELVHVEKWSTMETHMNNADGVPSGIVIVATNAGVKGTAAETWRKNALANPGRWRTHLWSQPTPWASSDDIAEAKIRHPLGGEFERLWNGKWISGAGDALKDDDIRQCFDSSLQPASGAESGWDYVAGIDIGVHHDHTGLVILGVHRLRRKIRVVEMQDWKPGRRTKKVDLIGVQQECLRLHRLFRIGWFGYDPHQAELMVQNLSLKGIPMRAVPFTEKNLVLMAETLIQVVESGILECYEDARLLGDFGKFNLVKKSYGYRLEATSDETGHADVGTALVIALPQAVKLLKGYGGLAPEDELIMSGEEELPLDQREIKAWPDELREMYEVYDELEKERWKIQGVL